MNRGAARSGIIVVDKAAGMTSFAVVAALRRALGVRRIGHAGTLDPAATGVLPVLIGQATKLMPYLSDQDKEYVVTIRFGVTTDTQDLTGRVLATTPVPRLGPDELDRACQGFLGAIEQRPPMYSAIHHEGRRLYELAREGVEVTRVARTVVIHSIAVENVDLPRATLRIVCGKGTYVRALAADLGTALGVGGAVDRLVRSRVGPFTLAEAIAASAIGPASIEALWSSLRPPEAALADWPAVHLDGRAAAAFLEGRAVDAVVAVKEGPGLLRVHAARGRLLGVGAVLPGGRVRPVRVLHADHPGPRVLPA